MIKTLRIKNWKKFQHFKDRRPPWIKLYRDILDDIEWHELDASAAKTLVMLWLIASENEGELPSLKTLAFRLRMTERCLETIVSKLGHWVEQSDIGPISDRYQSDPLETETETETEGEKIRGAIAPARTPLGELSLVIRPDLAAAVLAHRVKLKAPLSTVLAARALGRKLAGWPEPNAAAEEMLANGWRGFEPTWMKNRQNGSHDPPLQKKRSPTLEAADRLIEKFANEKSDASNVIDIKPNR